MPDNKTVLVGILVSLLSGPVLLAQTPAAAGDSHTVQEGKPVFEEWSVLVIDGKKCGYDSILTTQIDTPTGPQFQTAHQEEFVVKRLNAQMKITESFKIVEDADGGVLNFTQTTSGVGSDIESSGVRDGDDLVVSSRGQTQRYHIPRLASLGPDKVRRLSEAVPLKPGQAFSFNTFSSDYPQATVTVSGTVDNQEMRNVRGVSRQLWKLTSEMSMMPGLLTTAWVDDKGQDVESVASIPGIGDLHEYVTNRAECMQQSEGTEIFATNLLHPQRAIDSPGQQFQAVYRISVTDLDRKLNLWNEGEQRILSSAPGSCDVEVTAQRLPPDAATWELPHADTPELHPYLQASSYLEVDSPEIQALAKQAVGNEKNPVRAAHFIENFVRNYITKKDYNVGFASAQETARSREGDCTEHAVLCAALGRAVGLPTRCVVGLGYIPAGMDEPGVANASDAPTGTFGFHMWAEAWIGPDQWVPMDAALNGFDIGHIAITKTAMSEINPLIDLDNPVMQLMQNLKIEVLKIVPHPVLLPAPAASTVPTPAAPQAVTPPPPPSQERPAPRAPVPERPALPPLD